ncbi:hypothetical protein MTO96_013891 [Rhipicephalus appendiculatus]
MSGSYNRRLMSLVLAHKSGRAWTVYSFAVGLTGLLRIAESVEFGPPCVSAFTRQKLDIRGTAVELLPPPLAEPAAQSVRGGVFEVLVCLLCLLTMAAAQAHELYHTGATTRSSLDRLTAAVLSSLQVRRPMYVVSSASGVCASPPAGPTCAREFEPPRALAVLCVCRHAVRDRPWASAIGGMRTGS